jgi:endonuclease/exonuclease/phosphatase family metal-dependent hydrolase
MKKTIRLLLLLILIPVIYFALVIVVGSITNYSPEKAEVISHMDNEFIVSDSSTFSALVWNIGYAGLGAEMDFFYDGGEKVRDTEDNVRRNFQMIKKFLSWNEHVNFILLQEVDEKSRRSYKLNEVEDINFLMAGHFPFFAPNYKSVYVPVPVFKPLGQVKSGLLTLSSHVPQNTTRFSFPGNYAWPKSNFMLKRCFLVNRYTLNNGKELLIINTHNSAYDDGSLRKQQMDYLKDFLIKEERKGNYILVGGDWNQCPPEFKPNFSNHLFDTVNLSYIDKDYLPENWNWIYDSIEPTNRRISIPYEQGKTPVTLIDFFLASPNIEIIKCKNISMEFKYSDHQPVYVEFKLKSDE